jgi:hypothetical protein
VEPQAQPPALIGANRRRRLYQPRRRDRISCAHCGVRGGKYGWSVQACANKRRVVYMLLCPRCDVELNALMLSWFGIEGAEALLREYATEKGVQIDGVQ